MMKLILSSCDFRNEHSRQFILDNLPKPIAECRLLFIPNEKSTSDKVVSGKYHARMAEFGFTPALVRVLDYTNPAPCFGLDIDVLYVSGGNTFATLDRIRKSGFDREMIHYIQSGVTYIGGSAGAHIVCNHIPHVARYDTPPEGMTDLQGLGLADMTLLCHFASERQAHYDELLQTANGKSIVALTDEQSILIT
ncbi:MAG: Type 1 glutamine amidotransferase-like domain-containing protein [Clostridia bacterium]|nr:Type 1 glutamine amidotransferase-like domain-containing protein [Clostridia bacterium]